MFRLNLKFEMSAKLLKQIRNLGFLIFLLLEAPSAVMANDNFIPLPSPLNKDADILTYYWDWLTEELNAPLNIPYPSIKVGDLPANKLMGLMFPTFNNPQTPLEIIISKREMNRSENGFDLEVLGNVAHEIVHYLLLLSDHNWDHTQSEFMLRNNAKEHCDPEFMRLVRHFGTFVWNAYHSNYTVRAINQTVSRSCWEEGQILN
mgnify:FL=1|jgi:hypothetical protein